jgi:SAM-dependent methyltransferase
MELAQKNWFENWFESPYYDLLYSKRNEEEASNFIDKLLQNIPDLHGPVLDLACGKGRHAVHMHRKGFEVTGTDLSKRSIEEARKHQAPGLEFFIQDMRNPLTNKKFGLILNLFTSIGYFDDVQDNLKVLNAVKNMLQPNGTFVLDFLNKEKVISTLVTNEEKHFERVNFLIKRKIEHNFVIKDIYLKTEKERAHFQEKVYLFRMEELQEMLAKAGMHVRKTYGDYHLNPFNEHLSDRTIIIASH